MSPIYVPGKVVLRKTWQPMDADAAAYITAVETADGQALEEKVKIAIDNFVLGCKADGIWTAIKASCILAGARTLAGALVPLVGTAPTNVGGLFVQADYNRKTGLVGDGSTKHLNSSRNNNADPQNSKHIAIYGSSFVSGAAIAGITSNFPSGASILYQNVQRINDNGPSSTVSFVAGLCGVSRAAADSYSIRSNQTTTTATVSSTTPFNQSLFVFRNAGSYGAHRLAFYSIGESLDLALLDARVTTLINAFGAAIP